MTDEEMAAAVVHGLADPPWRKIEVMDWLEGEDVTVRLSCGHVNTTISAVRVDGGSFMQCMECA